jgi:hypothetical protein
MEKFAPAKQEETGANKSLTDPKEKGPNPFWLVEVEPFRHAQAGTGGRLQEGADPVLVGVPQVSKKSPALFCGISTGAKSASNRTQTERDRN